MKVRILSATDVKTALPMADAIAAMRPAYGQYSAGDTTVPLRTQLPTEKGVSLLMPAYMHKTQDIGIKLVSIYGDNPSLGLPIIHAAVLILDPQTGVPKAFMDGGSLTAIRTGAAGGLAAELLSREDARVLTLFGAGVQARTQMEAVLAVRPVERVIVVDPNADAARQLAQTAQARSGAPQIEIASDPQAAVGQADIIAAATTATTPVFDGSALRPGTHITGVGSYTPQMQEIDAHTVNRARIVVDSREACAAEAGDLIAVGAKIDAELGEIVNGKAPGRQNETEITFFKSVGIAAQDAMAAAAVLASAEKHDLGTLVDMS